jgi:hypothetical protein
MILPSLAGALLHPLQLRGNMQALSEVLFTMRAADAAAATAGTTSRSESGSVADTSHNKLGRTASYALSCLSDAACRSSLACWVLTWHSCMLQQGGDYGSVASR